LLAEGRSKGQQWLSHLQSPDSLLAATGAGPYISRLDSLQTMLQFMPPQAGTYLAQLQQQAAALKSRLGQLQEHEQWLQQHQAQWAQLWQQQGLGKLLPSELRQLQTQALTLRAQAEDWKTILNQPGRAEQEALRLLNKLPAFQRFMQQNGELARLFGTPNTGAAGAAGTASLAGLQTIQGMQQLLQQRFGNGQQVQQQLQSQLQAGMAQISQAQQQLNGLLQQGGSVGNTAITPYQQEQAALKSKTFWQRIELGWNLQTGQRVRQFPASNDLALSAGYKLNPNSVIGIGIAYKFGLGTWQKISLSHEGIGLRSFIDWRLTNSNAKLFANFWLTGGYELNYWQRMERLTGLRSLAWQQSGVIGLTKQVKVGKQTSKMQVLVDVVQLPSGQPGRYLLVRVGKGF
jgi:hypothetical protein